MAINYTEVGWDTSKYVNPTNMNQMDDGIKAACDGVDTHDAAIAGCVKLNKNSVQTIYNSASTTPLAIKGGGASAKINFVNAVDTFLGQIGVNANNKPIFRASESGADIEIALKSDLTAQTSTVSTNTYTTANSVLANSIIKCGNIVHLNLMMYFNEGHYVPTGTAFATVPTGYRPSADRQYAAMIQAAGGVWYGYTVTVSTAGQIKQGLTSGCQGVCISIAYEI